MWSGNILLASQSKILCKKMNSLASKVPFRAATHWVVAANTCSVQWLLRLDGFSMASRSLVFSSSSQWNLADEAHAIFQSTDGSNERQHESILKQHHSRGKTTQIDLPTLAMPSTTSAQAFLSLANWSSNSDRGMNRGSEFTSWILSCSQFQYSLASYNLNN